METLRAMHPKYKNYFVGSVADWIRLSKNPTREHYQHTTNARKYKSTRAFDGASYNGWLGWFGTENREELESALATMSFPRALNLMDKETRQLLRLPTTRRRLSWDTLGDELDRNRLYSGERECWRVARKKPVIACPLITLSQQAGVNCHVNASVLMWRGIAALNFTDAAQASGYRVQIVNSYRLRGLFRDDVHGSDDAACTVIVKAHNQPVNINALSVAIALPAFFRYVMFSSFFGCEHHVMSHLGHAENMDTRGMYQNLFEIPESVADKRSADAWLKGAVERVKAIHDAAVAA